MPLGDRFDETGWIDVEGAYDVLRRDEGGRWRLSPSRRLWGLHGRRVRLVGVRVAFDELDVERVEPLG